VPPETQERIKLAPRSIFYTLPLSVQMHCKANNKLTDVPTFTKQLCSTPGRGRPAWLALIQIPALIDSVLFSLQNRQSIYKISFTLTSHITANASGMKWECLKSHWVNVIPKKSITDITLIMLRFTWPSVMLRLLRHSNQWHSRPFIVPWFYFCLYGENQICKIAFQKIPTHKHVLSQIQILKCHITAISTVLQATKHDSVISNVIQTSETYFYFAITNLIPGFSIQTIWS